MPDLNQLRDHGARHLAELIDHASPDDAPATKYPDAFNALDAIAKYTIALAIESMADITQRLMRKHAEAAAHPNQTDAPSDPD